MQSQSANKTEQLKPAAQKIALYHNPGKAALLSAILPGAGQVYNNRWWKVPIVYAALGTTIYFLVDNQQQYSRYRADYIRASTDSSFAKFNDPIVLNTYVDFYRRNRDYSVVALIAVYALNVVDAYVDAHLLSFDISDDISMHFEPYISPVQIGKSYQAVGGLQLSLRW